MRFYVLPSYKERIPLPLEGERLGERGKTGKGHNKSIADLRWNLVPGHRYGDILLPRGLEHWVRVEDLGPGEHS